MHALKRLFKMLMLILLCVYISFDPKGCGVPLLTELSVVDGMNDGGQLRSLDVLCFCI